MHHILNDLRKASLLDDETCNRVTEAEKRELFSVHWHIRTLLYSGVTLLAGGTGMLIYKNIDTIGHALLITLTGLAAAACLVYCILKARPYSKQKVESPGMVYDYILLLGCLLFLSFLGYLQWQYTLFGIRYGLSAFIPALVLLTAAYRFDHLGVLALGLTLFSSWLGITITPLDMLSGNDFGSLQVIYTGLVLSLLFGACVYLHRKKEFKKHFDFTYMNFASHLAGIACLAGLFTTGSWIWWGLLTAVSIFFIYRYAITERSFYFMLVALVYGYTGGAWIITIRLFKWLPDILSVYLIFIFYITSCMMLIRFLKKIRNEFRHEDLVLPEQHP